MFAHRILLVACLVLSTLAAVPSGAIAERSSGVVTHQVEDPDASEAFWTRERMLGAEPAPLPEADEDDYAGTATERGEPYLVAGADPIEPYEATAETSFQAAAVNAPIPFERFQIDNPAGTEFAKHGVLFFTSPVSGFDFACSGTAINSDNGSVVWTAGHCLYEKGLPSQNVVFVPGYEDHAAPLGTWAADQIVAPPQWVNGQDLVYDFGAFRTVPNESGTLVDVVGGRGIAFNQNPTEAFQSFGYPAVPMSKFDGEHLQSCRSTGSGRIVADAIAMGCDMEQGSSGGGWVIRDEYVASNVSGGNMKVWPNMALGPYLGDAARAVYDEVRGGTSEVPQPAPTGPATPHVTHPMKITLRLRKHLIARGRLTATDGFARCAETTPIQLGKRRKNGIYYPIGRLRFTKPDGTYRFRIRDRIGRYLIFAASSPYDNSNNCAEAFGFARHRHI